MIDEATTESQLTKVVIPTCGRPANLRKAIDALVDCCGGSAELNIVVVDTSGTQPYRATRTPAARITYVGLEQIEHLVKSIAVISGVTEHLVRFGLRGVDGYLTRTGASRNLGMLAMRKSRFMFVDDDVIAKLYRYREAGNSAPIQEAAVPFSRFFRSRGALLKEIDSSGVSVFQAHESWLGRQVQNVGTDSVPHTCTDGTAAMTVRATVTGVAGDITNPSPAQAFYRFLASDFGQLLDDSDARELLEACEVTRCCESIVAGKGILTSGYCLGLDNTVLLPPWLPVLRSQDLVFGRTLDFALPTALACYLPWMVLHDRAAPYRLAFSQVAERHSRPGWGEIISRIVVQLGVLNSPKVRDLSSLGSAICGFAAKDTSHFHQSVAELFEKARWDRLSALQEISQRCHHLPLFARRELDRTITLLRLQITSTMLACSETAVPQEDDMNEFRSVLINFGVLLQSWSMIDQSLPEAWARAGLSNFFVPQN